MRRLLVLVSVVVAVDTLFFTALTPLVPHFADKYELSKAGAGVFISTYAAGTLIGAIPAGLATMEVALDELLAVAGINLMAIPVVLICAFFARGFVRGLTASMLEGS